MIDSIIAVAGTLLGAATTHGFQQHAARAERAETREQELRHDQRDAVAALASALADHRRTMWVREDLRLTSGIDTADYQTARADSHTTRAALTVPLATVIMIAPHLAEAAADAADAVYDLRGAPDMAELATLRAVAKAKAEHLVVEAAIHRNA